MRHVTKRALRYVAGDDQCVPEQMEPSFSPACGAPWPARGDDTPATSIRGIFKMRDAHDLCVRGLLVEMPSCEKCAVLLDAALEAREP